MDHLDDELELQSVKEGDSTYYEFFVDDVRFNVEYYNNKKFWKK